MNTLDSLRPLRFLELPELCYSQVLPTPLPQPRLDLVNTALAATLRLDADALRAPSALEWLAGNGGAPLVATLYAGHQFGVWVPQLGDGRALFLGELAAGGHRYELQLKGAGRTPYSRMGDGRAVLRSSLREYLCSEAMHGLGIPTTRALALVSSPQPVYREQVETAAVLTRVAESFIRFGHFEVLYQRGLHAELRALADHVLCHHLPQARDAANPYVAMLGVVVERTAELMAAWQAVGFCHGVMNTDNMSLLGLTLDYGPFGFIDGFDIGHICNHSDPGGRYAYNEQPQIALWNLYCLASCLLPLADEASLRVELDRYPELYRAAFMRRFRAKLGLQAQEEGDEGLLESLLQLMHAWRTDFTLLFRRLADFDSADGAANTALADLFVDREAWAAWAARYRERLQREASVDAERRQRMRAVNPRYVLRNYLAELAIAAARDDGDFSVAENLARCLARPFDEQPEFDAWAGFPPEWAGEISVSCSS